MKLRRETGFFNLKSDSEGNFKPILTGLGPEDFIGEIVDITYANGAERSISLIVSAGEAGGGVVRLATAESDERCPHLFFYHPNTGVFEANT